MTSPSQTNARTGNWPRIVISRPASEALVHVGLGMAVVVTSVSAFAVSTVFGIAATFLLALLVTIVMPASVPVIIICSFLYQNVAVAWFTPFIRDEVAFDALRGSNFVILMTAYGAFFAASFQYRLRPVTELRPWLLLSILLAGVICLYLGLGAVHGSPRDAIIYFRNTITPLACFHIAVVAASLYRVELRKSLTWLGSVAIVYGYCELIFKLQFLSLFHGDQYLLRAIRRLIENGTFEKQMHETGFVIRSFNDILMTNFFNSPLLADVLPQVFRINGPNFHPISYAYALSVISAWFIFGGRWLLALSALPLLLVVGSKGAMFTLMLALMARVLWILFGRVVAIGATVFIAGTWVVAAIVFGAAHGDYHVLGMIAGMKGFLHNPFGQGLGLGGNLSSTSEHINWERAQHTGATAIPVESAVGVMLYQMGIGSLVFFGFLAGLAIAAYHRLVRTADTDFLFALVMIISISANAVLQEEAFYSPLALGFAMLLIGTTFGTYFRERTLPLRPIAGRRAVANPARPGKDRADGGDLTS